MLVDASSGKPQEKVALVSPLEKHARQMCLTFLAHLSMTQYNANNSLVVRAQHGPSVITSTPVWQITGNYGSLWSKHSITLPAGEFRVVFEAVGQGSGEVGVAMVEANDDACVMSNVDTARCLMNDCGEDMCKMDHIDDINCRKYRHDI